MTKRVTVIEFDGFHSEHKTKTSVSFYFEAQFSYAKILEFEKFRRNL